MSYEAIRIYVAGLFCSKQTLIPDYLKIPVNRPAVPLLESKIPIQKRDRSLSLHLYHHHHHLQFLSHLSESQDFHSLTIKNSGAEKFSQEEQGSTFLERLNSPYLDYGSGDGSPHGQLHLIVLVLKKILDFSLGSE